MFRPEMLRPMGIPEDVNVCGWGLGLERFGMLELAAACNLVSAWMLSGRVIDTDVMHAGPP